MEAKPAKPVIEAKAKEVSVKESEAIKISVDIKGMQDYAFFYILDLLFWQLSAYIISLLMLIIKKSSFGYYISCTSY